MSKEQYWLPIGPETEDESQYRQKILKGISDDCKNIKGKVISLEGANNNRTLASDDVENPLLPNDALDCRSLLVTGNELEDTIRMNLGTKGECQFKVCQTSGGQRDMYWADPKTGDVLQPTRMDINDDYNSHEISIVEDAVKRACLQECPSMLEREHVKLKGAAFDFARLDPDFHHHSNREPMFLSPNFVRQEFREYDDYEMRAITFIEGFEFAPESQRSITLIVDRKPMGSLSLNNIWISSIRNGADDNATYRCLVEDGNAEDGQIIERVNNFIVENQTQEDY